jgi:Holliday junction resolvase-like predicted endonuclease
MTNKPKAIGTAGETAVVNYLRTLGYSELRVRRVTLNGSHDLGDVHWEVENGTLFVIEVKAGKAADEASPQQVQDWWGEAIAEAVAANGVPLLVIKRRGYGTGRVGGWRAFFITAIGETPIVAEAAFDNVAEAIKAASE